MADETFGVIQPAIGSVAEEFLRLIEDSIDDMAQEPSLAVQTPTDNAAARQTPETNEPLTFLGLERELRDRIYNMVLRSDCDIRCDESPGFPCKKQHFHPRNHLGCTKLLVLCRQVHRESIEILHKDYMQVTIPLRYREEASEMMFRHPRANGRPNFFWWNIRTSHRFVSPEPSELEFIRLRKIALVTDLPVNRLARNSKHAEWKKHLAYHGRLKDTAVAISKCTHLQNLRVLVDRELPNGQRAVIENKDKMLREDINFGLSTLLLCILKTAYSKGAEVSLGRNRTYYKEHGHDEDPIVPYLLQEALHQGVFVHREEDPTPNWNDQIYYAHNSLPSETMTFPILDDRTTNLLENTLFEEQLVLRTDPFSAKYELVRRVGSNKLVFGMHDTDLWGSRTDAPDFELIPECRKCYAIYPNREALDEHLAQFQAHRIAFRTKAYNQIQTWAKNKYSKTCSTCGKTFWALDLWSDHVKKMKHDRETVVPRWREDNSWWERMYVKMRDIGRLDVMGGKVARY